MSFNLRTGSEKLPLSYMLVPAMEQALRENGGRFFGYREARAPRERVIKYGSLLNYENNKYILHAYYDIGEVEEIDKESFRHKLSFSTAIDFVQWSSIHDYLRFLDIIKYYGANEPNPPEYHTFRDLWDQSNTFPW